MSKNTQGDIAESAPQAAGALVDLKTFFPYQLAVLAEQVSRTIAQLYADRFDLTRHEWRVLATLAEQAEVAAKAVAEQTALDKMSVSRAVALLEGKAFLTREEDPADRRNKLLRLTVVGRALYQKIAPLALAREAYLLEILAPDEQDALRAVMERLLARAKDLQSRG